MSSTVLARKYRPRNFAAMVGQEHVVQALSNALTQQRLHHAYLFTGTRGVGKTTVARVLAKSLNCTGPDGLGGITATPCGVCAACSEIDAGRFIDYVELDAASNRGIDEITQLLDQSVYKPVSGRFKVYLIDEVHMLTTTAFNAMLKTLEEPPDYLKFVLATTDPQKVPATVLSRCLQFNLRPMAPATIVDHLGTVLAAEAIVAEPAALRLLARAAHGSMRDALSLADQAIAFGSGRIEAEQVRQMLGAVDRGHAVRIVEALAARDGAALIAAVDGLRELGLSAAGTLEEMATLLQQMAVLQVVPEAADPTDPDAEGALALAGRLAADETQLLYSIVIAGRAELALAPDEYSGLVMVLLRLLAFAPAGPDAQAAPPGRPAPAGRPAPPAPRTTTAPTVAVTVSPTAPTALIAPPITPATIATKPPRDIPEASLVPQAVLSAGEPTPPALAPPSPTPTPSLTAPAESSSPPRRWLAADDALERWIDLVRELVAAGLLTAMVRELAVQSECVAASEADGSGGAAVWRLRVERENLRAPALREKLQGAVARGLDREVRIEIEPGPARQTVASRDAAERARQQSEAERVIHDDPLVKALLAQYTTARIVPGSVKPL